MSMQPWSRRGFLRRALGVGCIGAALGFDGVAPAFAVPSDELRIALFGDSMIDGIWGGLLRAVQKENCAQGGIKLGRYGMIGTGLTRSGEDAFQSYGPDASGSRIQIRASDGIHFTTAGYDMVTAYLLPKIIAHLKANKLEIAYPCQK